MWGGGTDDQYHGIVPDDEKLLLLRHFQFPCVWILPRFSTFLSIVTAAIQLAPGTLMVVAAAADRVAVKDEQSSSLHTHYLVITAALQIPHICISLHC